MRVVNNRYLNVLRTGLLISDVPPYSRFGNCADATDVVTAAPKSRHPSSQPRKFFSQFVRRESFELCRQMRRSQSWVRLNKHVNVVGHNLQCVKFGVHFLSLLIQQLSQTFFNRSDKHLQAILGTPHQVIFERVDRSNTDTISGINHETSVAQKLDIRKEVNRRTALLCPLKRAVPCGF
jgi:hypothetical protein